MHKPVLCLVVVTTTVVAQSYTITPSAVGTGEGNSNSSIPWTFTTARYQQIHGDLRGNIRTITALALRRDGALGLTGGATARTIDAEYFMADSDFATVSATYASNYASPPINVVTRKMINLPDWTAAVPTPPAPWSFSVPFDVPYPHTGIKDLLWEVVIYSNTATGQWLPDGHQATLALTGPGTSTGLSSACLATGRTSRMSLIATQTTSWSTQLMSLSYTVSNGPASAASSFLLGLVNPRLTVPSLCAQLFVDQVFLTINTTSSASGSITSGATTLPYNPLLVGFKVDAQAAALDAGQTAGLPVALSNGTETAFASMPPPPSTGDKVARVFAPNNVGTIGTLVNYFGLVVQLTH